MSAWIVYSKDGKTKRCETRKLEYSGEFMGACSVSISVSSPSPIDFEIGDYLEYRGERFEMNYDPSVVKSSSKNTYGEGFVYDNVVFNSLSDELTRCDFLDYVSTDNQIHYSSLPTFNFFADSIDKLAERIKANLDRVYKDDKEWAVEVHSEYEGKGNVNISVSNMTVWDALSLVNSQFGATFIIRNRTITIGTAGIPMEKIFSYGKGKGLSQIERNAESNQKIITRLRAYGSTRNMPSGYYHNLEGGNVPNNMAVNNLMLPDFPEKTHDPYIDSENIEALGVREGTIFFDGSGDLEEIYPSMEGMTAEDLKKAGVSVSSEGSLDVVLNAEQISDNGKFEEGDTISSFTITLKDIGFDINDYLSTSAATISMKDGMCGGREFEIVSCEKQADGTYLLTCNRSEDTTLGLYFPYADYQIKTGDKFVLLNIEMPDVYVKAASQRLLEAAKAYLAKNDYVRYSYSPTVDNIFMARQHDEAKASGLKSIYETIKEGDLMMFEDDDMGVSGNIIIDTLNIKEDLENSIIPEYEITLKDEKVVGTIERLQNQIDSIVRNGVGSSDNTGKLNTEQITSIVKAVGDKTFLRKDKSDRTAYDLGVKSLTIADKQVSSFVRYTDIDKPSANDSSFYSSLMTDMRIEEEMENLGDKYLRKDKEDTAHKHITFEEGITVYQLAKMMNLEVEELATIAKAIVNTLSSSTFVDGFAGEGYQIWKNIATGDWSMTLDVLTVRKMMVIYELIIQKIRSVGGMIVVSAGNGKVKEVERVGIEYKFTFEDTNTFAVNDLMRCQVFSPSGLKSYWVEVTRVEGENVYARVADFGGVVPESGDECVLMGNTKNPLRQNLILISATEDGKPRFDCLDGVKSKNFEGCLRTRVGCLEGIQDDRFPSDMQPKGYGLYADNCYLTGVFVLSNGNEITTQFTIMEGMIRSEISSVRAEINAKDNYLSNASFASNLELWTYDNDVKVFKTSGGLLYFNNNFYSIKNNFAGVVVKDSKNVLRIKKSFITQKNEDYNLHPSFDLYEDEETGEKKYRPRMFYVSFKYLCVEGGTMKVYFKDEANDGTFESYTPINIEKWIDPNVSFTLEELEGKWNGTGDFHLEFDGDIYIYDLALSDNALADVEEKFTSRFEATDKKIQANAEAIVKNGEQIEAYYGEFVITADSLRSEFNKKITDTEGNITKAYTSKIEQTAEALQIEYKDLISGAENRMYLYADGIKDDLERTIEDVEDGLRTDFEADIDATYEDLTTNYEAAIEDLVDGTIDDMQTSIQQNAKQISLRAYQTDLDELGDVVDGNYAEFTTTSDEIKGAIGGLDEDMKDALNRINDAEEAIDDAQQSVVDLEDYVDGTFKDYVVDASEAAAIREHLNTLATTIDGIKSTYSSVISHSNLSGTTEKTLLTRAYNTLITDYNSLVSTIEDTIDDGEATVTEIAEVNSAFDDFNISLDSYNDALEEARYKISSFYANAAVETAEQALYDALPEDWQAKDGTYASSLAQMAEGLSAVAGRFDDDGNLIEGAGWVTTSEGNTLWAGKDLESGNKIISYINQTATTTTINASKINLIGQVTFSMLSSDAQNKIDGKLDESTIISGNYIKTSLIDVDSIVVKKLEATNSEGWTLKLDSGGFVCENSSGVTLLEINADGLQPAIGIYKSGTGNLTLNALGIGYTPSSGGATTIDSKGLTLASGAKLYNFSIGNITSGSPSGTTDFTVMSSNGSLPSASTYKGKMIFIKFSGSRTLSGTIVPRNSASSVSSVTHSNLSAAYISNGSSWYEFLSVD